MANYDVLRARLLARLNELAHRADVIEQDLRKPGDRDWTERATEIENDEVLEGLDDITLADMEQLRHAIERIDTGSYGRCTRCGSDIGAARLEALPAAALCLACADVRSTALG